MAFFFFFSISRKDTLRNSPFAAEAGAQNAIDPAASTMWPVCVGYDGVYRASAGARTFFFFFFLRARFWTLSGSYTQHKDVDSYTNTRIDSGVCPGQRGMAARLGLPTRAWL